MAKGAGQAKDRQCHWISLLKMQAGGGPKTPDRAALEPWQVGLNEALKGQIRALPGSVELLKTLTHEHIKWCIATSGGLPTAKINLKALGLNMNDINIVTRDDVKYGKPDPDLFLAAAQKLNAPIEDCVVVGDAVWDMLAARRCKATGVGLLSGGYDISELERAGALRVYEDPQDLLLHLEEIASRP